MMIGESPELKHILNERIRQSVTGTITYSEYMEIALYNPDHGYYKKKSHKIGTSGDFYTSSSVHPVFAWVFAEYFQRYFEHQPPPHTICEIGGGNGSFARNVLSYLEKSGANFLKDLTYMFIDVSGDHQQKAREALAPFSNVSFFDSVDQYIKTSGTVTNGIVFSNELLDAFLVDVIEKLDGEIYEIHVAITDDGELSERAVQLDNPAISQWLEWSRLELSEGQRIEVPLAMLDWIGKMSDFIQSGLLVTVDYGYTDEEWQEPSHRKGSLRGYKDHQLIEDPLHHPGEMDLTTHIHLDSFMKKGKEKGFNVVSCMRQRDFLLENGLFEFLTEHQNRDPFSEESRLNRAIRSFATPGGISDSFHVVVLEKGK